MGEKDLFYDLLANPQLTLGDLEAVGHSTQNTRLFSRDYYKNNEKVREFIPAQNPNGIIGLYDKVEGKFYENTCNRSIIFGSISCYSY